MATIRRTRDSRGLVGALLLLGMMQQPTLADNRSERWEYGERRGVSALYIGAIEAKRAVEASRDTWHIGSLRRESIRGTTEVKADIYTDAGRIATLRIDPQTGDVLPYTREPPHPGVPLSQPEILQRLETVLPALTVGEQAWPGGHGRYWRIPLFLDGVLVGTVRVGARTGKLLHSRRHDDDD